MMEVLWIALIWWGICAFFYWGEQRGNRLDEERRDKYRG